MFSSQRNANRTNMFAILEKQKNNQVALDYGNNTAGGKEGYPLSYNDSSSRTHVLKINALKPNSASNQYYVANTYSQTKSRVSLLRRPGSAAPRKVGAIKRLNRSTSNTPESNTPESGQTFFAENGVITDIQNVFWQVEWDVTDAGAIWPTDIASYFIDKYGNVNNNNTNIKNDVSKIVVNRNGVEESITVNDLQDFSAYQSYNNLYYANIQFTTNNNTKIPFFTQTNGSWDATVKQVEFNDGTIINFDNIPVINYKINVTATSNSDYTFIGNDRLGSYNSVNDPTLTFDSGDVIEFNVDAPGHPFYIKTTGGVGTLYQATGVINNGITSGFVTWDTTGISPATYYYQCSEHPGQVGEIVIRLPLSQPIN